MVLQLFTWCWLIMTLYRMALRFIESLVGGVQLGQTLTEGLGKDLSSEKVPWPPPPNLAFPPSRLLVMGCRPPPSGLEIPCLDVCDGGSSWRQTVVVRPGVGVVDVAADCSDWCGLAWFRDLATHNKIRFVEMLIFLKRAMWPHQNGKQEKNHISLSFSCLFIWLFEISLQKISLN